MSVDEGSSGEEYSLQIDTDRRSEGKGGRGKGRSVKRRGGGRGSGEQPEAGGDPKPGDVVWAKVMGFNFWPAKIFDSGDEIVPVWLKQPPKPSYILVRFFGTYDMQWVSPSSVETYDKGLKKKFHSKSKSKVFQKAVKEVFTYREDLVLPEGLTLPPPDPPTDDSDGENDKDENEAHYHDSDPSLSGAYVVTCDPESFQLANNGSAYFKGSSRRKSATPRRLSSSSSDSQPKRHCTDGAEGGRETGRVLSPEVEAFTCAPLPLVTSASSPIKENVGGGTSRKTHPET